MTSIIIVLLLVGLILMAMEVLVIPGFGVAGILGIICMGVGAVLSFSEFGMMAGIGVVVATVVFGIALIVFVARSRFARKMELDSSGGKSGVPDDRQQWLGRKGVAVSMLRPSGTGQFDGERLTVLTEGEFVHKGTPIKVVRIEGGKLVVEPAEAQNEAQNEAQKEKPADAQNEAQKEKPKE